MTRSYEARNSSEDNVELLTLIPLPCYVFTFVQTRHFYAKKSIEPAPFVREIEPLVSIDCDLSAERFRDDQDVSDFGSVRPGKNSFKSLNFKFKWICLEFNQFLSMEQHALKINNCLNTNIYSYLDIWRSKI